MTYQQLKDAVVWEGKIQNNTEALAQLNNLIEDVLIFIGQTHPELLLADPVTYDAETDNPTPYVACLGIESVEMQAGDLEAYELPHQDQVVGPPPFPNWPKCYTIEGNAATSAADPKGLRIRLIPSLTNPNSELLIVTYKKVPTLSANSDIVPAAWIPYLKKEILARLALQRAKAELDVAKAHKADATQAVQAHMSTESGSVAASN